MIDLSCVILIVYQNTRYTHVNYIADIKFSTVYRLKTPNV